MEDPAGYLHRTAMNLFRSQYRRAARGLKRAIGARARAGRVPIHVEDRDVAAKALAALTPRQRAALVLTEALGYSGEETGRLLGSAPRRSTRSRIKRGWHCEPTWRRPMPDLRSIVDRELERIELRPFTLESFHRRRERKRRNERIRAGVVGIVIALMAVLIGTSIVRSRPAPASPHPLPPARRHAELTFSDDAGIVAIDLASGRRQVVAPGVSAAGVLMVSGRLGPGVRIHDRAVLGGHPRHRDGRGSRPCGLRLARRYGGSVDWSADGAWIAFSTSSNERAGEPG